MNAIAVDMESAAVARTAQASGVGFAAVRAISDEVDFDVPAAALAGLNDDGSISAAAVLTALCKQPREFRALLELARRFQRAEKSLRQAARWLQDT
jgi:6-phosphogluconate dehydrogenase